MTGSSIADAPADDPGEQRTTATTSAMICQSAGPASARAAVVAVGAGVRRVDASRSQASGGLRGRDSGHISSQRRGPAAGSGVVVIVIAGVALELERRVLDAELGRTSSAFSSSPRVWASCRVSSPPSTTWAESAGVSEPIDQTCRWWTASTPSAVVSACSTAVDVEPLRRAFEQHPGRVPQQLPGRDEHEDRDEDRDQRVDPLGAGRHHDESGDDHADRARRVGREVQERAAQVQAVAARRGR